MPDSCRLSTALALLLRSLVPRVGMGQGAAGEQGGISSPSGSQAGGVSREHIAQSGSRGGAAGLAQLPSPPVACGNHRAGPFEQNTAGVVAAALPGCSLGCQKGRRSHQLWEQACKFIPVGRDPAGAPAAL